MQCIYIMDCKTDFGFFFFSIVLGFMTLKRKEIIIIKKKIFIVNLNSTSLFIPGITIYIE